MSSKYKKLIFGILYTVIILLVYRLGYFIHLPFIRHENLEAVYNQGSLFGFLDIFSGGALSNFSIVALGVSPYITASIVTQLLQMDIVPALKEWGEEGEEGKEKLNTLTKYLAIFLAFVQAMTLVVGVNVSYNNLFFGVGTPNNAFTYVYLSLVMTAGTGFVLWIADRITKKGIGNGTSIMIVVGIIASYPNMISDLINTYLLAEGKGVGGVAVFVGTIALMILIILAVVFMEAAQRKIPIQYANRPASATFQGRNESNIPIKLNSASVIPVIFASTLMSLPTTIGNFLAEGPAKTWLNNIFNSSEPIGFALYIILIVVFTFFYSFLQMSPDKMAENLQKQNAYVPSVRAGEETAAYISRVLFKINVVGALYLSVLASLPIIWAWIFKDLPASVQVGGTGLIIVVGVAVETWKQIKSTTQEKQYRGFMN